MERIGATDHPDELVTASYLDGMLPSVERDRFEAHLSLCDHCREGLTLLSPVVAGSDGSSSRVDPVPAEFLARARSESGPAGGSRMMAAAAVLFMVGLTAAVWWARPDAPSDTVVYRDLGDQAPLNPRPGPGTILTASRLIFTWDPVEGADRYAITVMRDDELLLTMEVPAGTTTLRWPDGHPAPVAGPLRWQVKALALDRVVAESRNVPFEVR